MDDTSELDEIKASIDAAHERAKKAFAAKDIDAYMAVFSPSLAYKQINGKTISFEQLRRDVSAQFRRLTRAESSFFREQFQLAETKAVEHLTQTAVAEEKFLFFFTRKYQIHRRATYTWGKDEAGWAIVNVEVLEERVS